MENSVSCCQDKILQRHETGGNTLPPSVLANGGAKTRQQDFLRGLTMKIRFRKVMSMDDADEQFVADDGKVTFSSYDQVQMKLTHIEMNSAYLVTNCNALGQYLNRL